MNWRSWVRWEYGKTRPASEPAQQTRWECAVFSRYCISNPSTTNYRTLIFQDFLHHKGTLTMAEKTVSTESFATEVKKEYKGEKLRVAVIGCGGISETHIASFKKMDDVELV